MPRKTKSDAVEPHPKQLGRRAAASPSDLPGFRPFQLATLADKLPSGDGWLFEMKYDGYRCQAAIAGNQVRLFSRGGFDWTRQ